MQEKIYEEWTKPDWTTVDSEHLQKLEENNESYESAIDQIIDEVKSDEDLNQRMKNIQEIIDDLQEEIYYV